MGLAVLNPLSRLRSALRGLILPAVNSGAVRLLVADVGELQERVATGHAALASMIQDSERRLSRQIDDRHGALVDAVRESEARILSSIAEFRARHGFIGDPVVARPTETGTRFWFDGLGRLSGDPTRPREVKAGPVVAPADEYRRARHGSISRASDHPLGTSAMGSATP